MAARLLVESWALSFTFGFAANVIFGAPLTRTVFLWCWVAGAALAALGEALRARSRPPGTEDSGGGQRMDAGGGTA